MAGVPGTARGKLWTIAVSATTCGESQAGGGADRNWLAEVNRRGTKLGPVTLPGLVPTHLHGPTGTVPDQTASEPSAFAFAMTCSATLRPRSSPAKKSLGY